MVSELTEVHKVLEPSHIFITQRILVLFGKPEGLYQFYYLMVGIISKLKPELKPKHEPELRPIVSSKFQLKTREKL